jgi:hypothetical protein
VGSATLEAVGRRDRWRRVEVGAAATVYSWWATSLAPFSRPALVAVVGAGVAAMAWGSRRPPLRPSRVVLPPVHRALGILLLVVVVGWELTTFLQQPRAEHPTVSVFANRALDPHPFRALGFMAWLAGGAALARCRGWSARWLVLAGWLWLGWHLFVRASH